MTEILITGGAGSFGRLLAHELRKEKHTLRIFDLPACDFSFFKDWENTRIIPGDILDEASVQKVIDGAEMIFHLAAILPPVSEIDREKTFRINTQGTQVLLDACTATSGLQNLIFASSVSVFGDTSEIEEPIQTDHPVNPNDWYAESKVEAERILKASGVPYTNLRISGVVIPAFLDPPEPWPFMRRQRIELVTLADLVSAMVSLVKTDNTLNRTLIIAGGNTWQVTGERYVERWGRIMDIPLEDMNFMEKPGWLNWYDTSESQTLLNYQKTALDSFYKELHIAVEEALA